MLFLQTGSCSAQMVQTSQVSVSCWRKQGAASHQLSSHRHALLPTWDSRAAQTNLKTFPRQLKLQGHQKPEMLYSPNFQPTTPSHCSCPQGNRKGAYPHLEVCTHRGQVLLREALALPALLDHFSHLQGNSVMVQLLCFTVKLGRVLCNEVLFVLACCPCHLK